MKKESEIYSVPVNTQKTSDPNKRITESLSQKIVGQPRAIRHIARLMVSAESRLRDPRRPIGVMIFAGPTGVGKTEMAKELSQTLLGSMIGTTYPLTIVQCSNLAEPHRISTLIGAPPGYVDSHKIPLLHRFNIEKYALVSFLEKEIQFCKDVNQRQKKEDALKQVKICLQSLSVGKLWLKYDKQDLNVHNFLNEVYKRAQPLTSIILFDEIEKAHPDVWNLLLGIIEDGQLQLANNNETTSFANSLIILTTNTGSREIQGVFGANRIGFKASAKDGDQDKLDQAVYGEAKKALEKMFPPELMGRLGKEIIAFRSLRREDYDQIFYLLIEEFKKRLNAHEISVKYTPEFRRFVVDDGFKQKYGARALRDAVNKYVETPTAFALSSGELQKKDDVLFVIENDQPVLRRRPRFYSEKDKQAEQMSTGRRREQNMS